jgi:hypothetical protein
VSDTTFEGYCDNLARLAEDGDHLSLIATSEVFGVAIKVISSLEGNQFTTDIIPSMKKVCLLLVCFFYIYRILIYFNLPYYLYLIFFILFYFILLLLFLFVFLFIVINNITNKD